MKIVVVGACEKHDFILTAAILLKSHFENNVAIVTDSTRAYQYFDGEISGVSIHNDEQNVDADITIYDWHNQFPTDVHDAKVVFAASYERFSLDRIESLLREGHTPSAMIVMEEESKIDLKYVEKNVPVSTSLFVYITSSIRKIDWVYDGRVDWKVEKDFAEAVEDFLIEICDVPEDNLKKLWKYARKRG